MLPGVAVRAASGTAAAESADDRELRALDLMVRAGRAFKTRHFVQAAELYRAAWAIDPLNGQALCLAGVAAFEGGQYASARRDLQQALAHGLAPDDRELARSYLDLIPGRTRTGVADPAEPVATTAASIRTIDPFASDPTAPPLGDVPSAFVSTAASAPAARADTAAPDLDDDPLWTPTVTTAVAGGYDNARQLSRALDTDISPARAAVAPFVSGSVELAIDRALGRSAEVDLRYGLDQKAQVDRTLADLDSLEHEASVELTQRLGRLARLSLAATGTLSFTGLATRLLPFQRSLRIDPQIQLGRDSARLRLGLAWQRTETQDPALAHLSGRRLEVSASPLLTVAGWQLWLSGRLRQDQLGTARSPQPTADDPTCPGCTFTLVEPYSNISTAASARVGAPLRWRLRPALAARWERRLYDLPRRTELNGPADFQSSGGAQLRADQRLSVDASLQLQLTTSVVAGARFDESASSTTYSALGRPACVGAICPMNPPTDTGYHRRAFTLELVVHWL